MLAAELAAEARRRAGAEAVIEELAQYNTAVIEQAQARARASPSPKVVRLAVLCCAVLFVSVQRGCRSLQHSAIRPPSSDGTVSGSGEGRMAPAE